MKEKNFTIKVSGDNKYLDICCDDMAAIGVFPAIAFVKGTDPMSMESNIPSIVKHIKQMMIKEDYNVVICIENDLAIYNELVAELKHIEGLRVVLE